MRQIRNSRILILLTSVLVLVVLAVVFRTFSEPKRQVFSTSDGKALLLLGVTYGTNHTNPGLSPWLRAWTKAPAVLQRRTPKALSEWLFQSSIEGGIWGIQGKVPQIVLWFSCSSTPSNSLAIQGFREDGKIEGDVRILNLDLGGPVRREMLPYDRRLRSICIYEITKSVYADDPMTLLGRIEIKPP